MYFTIYNRYFVRGCRIIDKKYSRPYFEKKMSFDFLINARYFIFNDFVYFYPQSLLKKLDYIDYHLV